MEAVLTRNPDLGRVFVPEELKRLISLPDNPVRRDAFRGGEVGIFVAVHKRRMLFDRGGAEPIIKYRPEDLLGVPTWWETLMVSITHNERVDAGAQEQKNLVFATGTAAFKNLAIASGTLTKAKTDQSLGSSSSGVTTNEYTTIGLSRAAGTVQNYVAPSSLGGTFSIDVNKLFTASGGGTAYGAGIFNSTTVASSILYVEDNFVSTAVLVSGDTLNVTATITN